MKKQLLDVKFHIQLLLHDYKTKALVTMMAVRSMKTHNPSGDMQIINQDFFKVRRSGNLHLPWSLAKQINF